MAELEQSADYQGRRQAIREHNAGSRVIKRGLALTPVKFGISFTATQYNRPARWSTSIPTAASI